MKISPKYGERIITIPAAPVLDHLKGATAAELKVLIYALDRQDVTFEDIEKATGLGKEEITSALFTWKDLGVISCIGLKKSKAFAKNNADAQGAEEKSSADERGGEKEQKPKRFLASTEVPHYTSDQINNLIEKNRESKELIDACQNILGRTFNVAESSVIVKLVDYYKLTPPYIMLVCQHVTDRYGTNVSVRMIEKEVANNYDKEIFTYSELEEHYKNEAVAGSLEGRLRVMLGIGQRALSKKERQCLEKWVSYGYGFEVIELAFEVTVNNADKFNIGYMDAIIERWHSEGCTSLEDAEKAVKARKEENKAKRTKKKKDDDTSTSFDTDDFWEKALNRSYGE